MAFLSLKEKKTVGSERFRKLTSKYNRRSMRTCSSAAVIELIALCRSNASLPVPCMPFIHSFAHLFIHPIIYQLMQAIFNRQLIYFVPYLIMRQNITIHYLFSISTHAKNRHLILMYRACFAIYRLPTVLILH